MLLSFSIFAVSGVAQAADTGGPLGLGIIIGEPTGFSGAYKLSPKATVDGALAYSYARHGDWQIHGDYLFTGNRIFRDQPSELDTFIGGGARLKFENAARFGVRVPVGATYVLPPQPRFQLFGEIVPIIDFAPDTALSIDAAIGIRYFF